ncbi:hypothetical protein K445DRAFT_319066 [Daldinia sp. EC12]|nr:hypothetical protein K445DRAFT_319066 [Daldinia sp. EC12]
MRRTLLSFSIRAGLLLNVSASKLLFQPFSTQAQDGAFATPQPISTAAPEYYASTELLGRDEYHMGHDTCGFGAFDTGITYSCYSSIGKCENIGNFRGCCTGELKACSSTFWTKCDDYDPTSFCDMNSKTRCCQSALPYCITWLFSVSIKDRPPEWNMIRDFRCCIHNRMHSNRIVISKEFTKRRNANLMVKDE